VGDGALLGGSEDEDEQFFEQESFTKPVPICSYLPSKSVVRLWAERKVPFDDDVFSHFYDPRKRLRTTGKAGVFDFQTEVFGKSSFGY
jgi:hypothetical protein